MQHCTGLPSFGMSKGVFNFVAPKGQTLNYISTVHGYFDQIATRPIISGSSVLIRCFFLYSLESIIEVANSDRSETEVNDSMG